MVVLADLYLAAQAWLEQHHRSHPAAAVALAPLVPLRLLAGGVLACVALFMASRARRDFRYLLVGLGVLGGILAMTAERPALIAVAAADCLVVLLATSLWPESSNPRSSRLGWALLVAATAATGGLFVLQHPDHKLASFLTLVLLMAFAAAITGITLLDRNAALPSRSDPERAQALYAAHADAGVHPFALVGRKRHFWAADGSAFIAYGGRAGVALALGPAVGPPGCAVPVSREFREECRRRGWRPALYQIPARLARDLGWGHRYLLGSEAIVDLTSLSLAGPAMARLRHDVARGRRSGVLVTVAESSELDSRTTRAMAELAHVNSRRRRLGEMSFSVGRRGDRCDVPRVVGLAHDAEGGLVGFTTWLRLPATRTVVLDEVQRRDDAPAGAMDLVMWTGLKDLSASADRASLGLAPIAGSSQAERLARVETFLRKFLDLSGLAPGLYSFKAKFNPSWEPRYIVAERLRDWPGVWLAVFLLHYPEVLRRWARLGPGPRSETSAA
jgi:phosphatidylglycerol lysyltransferase